MPSTVAATLVELARAFESARVRWYVFGAQAVIAAGVPRLTADIDVTVEVPRKGTAALLRVLARHGFVLREIGDVESFIAETRVLPLESKGSRLPVDVVLAGPGLEEEMLARPVLRVVNGVPIPFVATADLVALKLLAGRAKDLEDVAALMRAAPADLSLREARARVVALGELLDDTLLVSTFDDLAASAKKKSKQPRGAPKKARKARNADG